jgi:hypothetical protein
MRRVPPRLFGKPPDDLVDPGGVVVDHELAKDMSRRVVPGGDGATALCLRIPVREKSDGIVTLTIFRKLVATDGNGFGLFLPFPRRSICY